MSKKLVLLTFIVMVLGAIATTAPCEEAGTILLPEHACMVQMSEPEGNNSGSQLRVRVGGNDPTRTFKSWLKFDVSGIDVQGLASATLTLALEHDRGPFQFDISFVNDDCLDNIDWTSGDLTWNNAPGNNITHETDLDPTKTTFLTRHDNPTGLTGEAFYIDVLEAFKSDTDGIVQLVLHNSNTYIKIASHTHSEEVWRPYLVLTMGSSPYNGEIDVPRDVVLSWLPGEYADTYDVYLGTDFNDVNEATRDNPLDVLVSKGQEETTYAPAEPLEFNQTYHWRVDEVNDTDPNSPLKGDIWSFTVANYTIVDDFEDYNDFEPDTVWNTWADGYDDPTNGSSAGYPNPFFPNDEHYLEDEIVHGGNWSMPLFYDNSIAMLSEVTKTLNADWSTEGFVTLSLWYNGLSFNIAEPMYVALNGNAVVTNDDANAALVTEWTQWDIPLQAFADLGVNLINVGTLSIGFGNKANPVLGGTGYVFFDDIRLYRPPVEP